MPPISNSAARVIGLSNDGRLILSAIIASAMLVHVSIAQHVQIVLSEPWTYLSLFQHKCGVALVGCTLWMLLELLGVFDTGSSSKSTKRTAVYARKAAFGGRVIR